MNNNQQILSRIAPTPSGYLHLGNVFNFLLTYVWVRKYNGVLRLRIDDIDASRRREEYVDDIFKVLDWLKLDYDEGPAGVEDFYKNYSQQLRLDIYEQALEKLWNEKVLFACICSRSQIKKRSKDGQYPGTCRDAQIGPSLDNVAWRVKTPQNLKISWNEISGADVSYEKELYDNMRDFVVKRKDGLPAYQLASVVDDTEHNINLIIRGQDLEDSTAAQLFISRYLGNSTFSQIQFLHHPLIKDKNQQKLSKSKGSISMRYWIERWKSPTECYRWIGQVLGKNQEEIISIEDLVTHFDPEKLKMAPFLP